MKITSEQASFISELSNTVLEKFNIKIGYASPMGSFLKEDDDFVLYEKLEEGLPESYLFHKDDYEAIQNEYVEITESSKNDEQCFQLFSKLNNGLLDGVLAFDPCLDRTVNLDGIEYKVNVRKHNKDKYSLFISTEVNGLPIKLCMTSTLGLLEERSKEYKIFEAALIVVKELNSFAEK